MTDAIVIEGARVVLSDRVETVSVRIEGGRIAALDGARGGARAVDARGFLLAPAFVDIHGDAFERQIMPRPGVALPVAAAMLETDRQLAANGIATAYHALTLSWEPGLRSVATGWEVLGALETLDARLRVENRVQLRWETFCPEAIDLIAHALKARATPAVAFNDHTSIALLDPATPMQDRPFEHDPGFPLADIAAASFAPRMEARARRSHMSTEAYVALLARVWERRADVPADIARVAGLARAEQAPMLSHDDSQPATRRFYRDIGARVAEFPMHERVLTEARAAGDLIVFGAPNAMRGGSHLGSPGAGEMVARGLCDILASDYYYPAMLGAVARLAADGVAPLHALWRLVAENPARAMGLADRGRIEPGLRADLVLVDWPEGGVPSVARTFAADRDGMGSGRP